MNRYNIHNITIHPSAFQHPMDKKATDLIQSQDAFGKALQFISKNSMERELRMLYRSSYAQLTPETAPSVFQMLEEACAMFGVDSVPDVYLNRTYDTAFEMRGIESPAILLSTELLRQLNEWELYGLLAALVSGIPTGYNAIRFVDWLCEFKGLIPAAISLPLRSLIMNWRKYVQFSFDRATLIAVQDLNTAMCGILAGESPMSVLRGMDFKDPDCDYMKQCREYAENTGHWTDTARDIRAFTQAGVSYASRYLALYQFANEEYFDFVEDFLEDGV